MKHLILATLASLALAPAVQASGDAEKGARDFNKCKACHAVASADEVIVKGGRTGPNLYGIIGRVAGSEPDFKYSSALASLSETGLVWTEDELVTYLADPTAWLKDATGDSGAKSKMTFKLKNGEDVAAWLATVSPAAEEEEGEKPEGS